jgi:hypothetical protein
MVTEMGKAIQGYDQVKEVKNIETEKPKPPTNTLSEGV